MLYNRSGRSALSARQGQTVRLCHVFARPQHAQTHHPVPAFVLERRPDEVYVHYAHADKRLDEWVLERSVRFVGTKVSVKTSHVHPNGKTIKRKRSASTGEQAEEEGGGISKELKLSEEEYDIEHHKQITAKRNFDKVNFGKWQIKTWCAAFLVTPRVHSECAFTHRYFSPYPLIENETDDPPNSVFGSSASHSSLSGIRIPGVSRSSIRSHGRTSDLFAGGLGRSHGAGDKSVLWVCDKCFKYMAEGLSWELHVVSEARPVCEDQIYEARSPAKMHSKTSPRA